MEDHLAGVLNQSVKAWSIWPQPGVLKVQVLNLIQNCIITANISEIKEKNGKSIANNGRVWYYNFEDFK